MEGEGARRGRRARLRRARAGVAVRGVSPHRRSPPGNPMHGCLGCYAGGGRRFVEIGEKLGGLTRTAQRARGRRINHKDTEAQRRTRR
jgi:hypothetical protein